MCNAETYMTYDELQKSVIRGYVLGLGIKCAMEVELSSIIETFSDRSRDTKAVVLEGLKRISLD